MKLHLALRFLESQIGGIWCSTVGSIGICLSCFYSITKTSPIVHFKRQIQNYLFPDWFTHSSALMLFTRHIKNMLLMIAKMSPLTYSVGGGGGVMQTA